MTTTTIAVAGVTFHQDAVKELLTGQQVYLRREPQNRFDPNAIRVETADGWQIGFLPKEIAAQMAPLIDETAQYPTAKVLDFSNFKVGRSTFVGVTLLLTSPE